MPSAHLAGAAGGLLLGAGPLGGVEVGVAAAQFVRSGCHRGDWVYA
mgnify:CR=1 FL=1